MVRLLALASAAAFVVAGCSVEMAMQATAAGKDSKAPPAKNAAQVPADAIAVGDDVYMVPIGADAEGCTMYRVFSPTKATVQAIHYRTAEGRFVMDKAQAACRRAPRRGLRSGRHLG